MTQVFDVTLFLEASITLVVIMDPPGTVPVFLSLVGRKSPAARAKAARQAVLVSLLVITLFAVAGEFILAYLGIGIHALQGAGGLLLLLVALDLLTGRGSSQPEAAEDVNVDRKSTRLNSSHVKISYAVFCLKKKKDAVMQADVMSR